MQYEYKNSLKIGTFHIPTETNIAMVTQHRFLGSLSFLGSIARSLATRDSVMQAKRVAYRYVYRVVIGLPQIIAVLHGIKFIARPFLTLN